MVDIQDNSYHVVSVFDSVDEKIAFFVDDDSFDRHSLFKSAPVFELADSSAVEKPATEAMEREWAYYKHNIDMVRAINDALFRGFKERVRNGECPVCLGSLEGSLATCERCITAYNFDTPSDEHTDVKVIPDDRLRVSPAQIIHSDSLTNNTGGVYLYQNPDVLYEPVYSFANDFSVFLMVLNRQLERNRVSNLYHRMRGIVDRMPYDWWQETDA